MPTQDLDNKVWIQDLMQHTHIEPLMLEVPDCSATQCLPHAIKGLIVKHILAHWQSPMRTHSRSSFPSGEVIDRPVDDLKTKTQVLQTVAQWARGQASDRELQ